MLNVKIKNITKSLGISWKIQIVKDKFGSFLIYFPITDLVEFSLKVLLEWNIEKKKHQYHGKDFLIT